MGLRGREGGQLLPSLQHIVSPTLPCLFYFLFCHLKYHAMVRPDYLETLVLLCWVWFPGSLVVPRVMLSSASKHPPGQNAHVRSPSDTLTAAEGPFSAAPLPGTAPPAPAAGSGQTPLLQIKPQMRPCLLKHQPNLNPCCMPWHVTTRTCSLCWDKDPWLLLQVWLATRLGTSILGWGQLRGCPPTMGSGSAGLIPHHSQLPLF